MPNSSKNAYLIWDFDGTLAFRDGMWSGTHLEILQSHNLTPHITIEHIRPHLMSGFRWHNHHLTHPPTSPDQWWAQHEPIFQNAFQQGAGIAPALAAQLAKKVRPTYLHPAKWQNFPDTHPTLSHLTTLGYQHILLTNHVPELPALLQTLNLDRHFTAVFNSAHTGIEKPHPQAFQNVRNSLPKNAPLHMIGDNFKADIQGAHAANIPAILVRKPNPAAPRYAESLSGVSVFLENP